MVSSHYIVNLRKYFSPQGRIARKEFWKRVFLFLVPFILLSFISAFLLLLDASLSYEKTDSILSIWITLQLIFVLVTTLFIFLANTLIKRLHDIGYSGIIIFFIFAIIGLVFYSAGNLSGVFDIGFFLFRPLVTIRELLTQNDGLFNYLNFSFNKDSK